TESQPDADSHPAREEQRAEGEEGARLAKVRHDLEVICRAARIPDAVVVRGDDSKSEVSQGKVRIGRDAARSGVDPIGIESLEAVLEAHTVRVEQTRRRVTNLDSLVSRP